jgi:hypothetical protein
LLLLEWHDSQQGLKLDLAKAWRTISISAGAAFTGLFTMMTTTGRGETAVRLEPGDVAPDFELRGSDGRTYRLGDFAGQRAVVVAWFPKAFTGG